MNKKLFSFFSIFLAAFFLCAEEMRIPFTSAFYGIGQAFAAENNTFDEEGLGDVMMEAEGLGADALIDKAVSYISPSSQKKTPPVPVKPSVRENTNKTGETDKEKRTDSGETSSEEQAVQNVADVISVSSKDIPSIIQKKETTRGQDSALVVNLDSFIDFLSQHSPNLLNAEQLINGFKGLAELGKRLSDSFKNFYPKTRGFWLFLGMSVFCFILSHMMHLWALKKLKALKTPQPFSYLRRVGLCFADFVFTGIIPALLFVLVFLIFRDNNLAVKEESFFKFIEICFMIAFSTLLLNEFLRNALSPKYEPKRLLLLKNEKAARIYHLLFSLMLVFFIDAGFLAILKEFGAGQSSQQLLVPIFTLLESYFIWKLAYPVLWRGIKASQTGGRNFLLSVSLVIKLAVFVVVFATLLGYTVLGVFIINRLIIIGFTWAALLFVYVLMKELLLFVVQKRLPPQTDKLINQIRILIEICLIPALFLVGLSVILPLFGISYDIYWNALKKLFIGFNVGEIKISLLAIILAVLSYIFLQQLFRTFQNLLKNQVFIYMDLDSGVQNSLLSVLGYIGVVVSLLISLSVAGVGLKNMTIILGALSVGIGFGLQNIANNIVSGLIILIERPLKVGDWIVVSSGEGIVKKINIRATEVETFDKACLIVPNSEILANSFKNWTHKDLEVRLSISLTVAYGSDVEKVENILRDSVAQDDRILKAPAPFITFSDFGEKGLKFDLRCYLGLITEQLAVQTALRKNIYRRFKEEGIFFVTPYRIQEVSPLNLKLAEGENLSEDEENAEKEQTAQIQEGTKS